MVRALLDRIIDSVVNLHSKNTDKSPITPPSLSLSTGATGATDAATTFSHDSSVTVATVRVCNIGNPPAVRRSLEIPANVPMSEEIGEQLFSQGYDRDGLIPCYYPEMDMQLLDNYSSIAIGKYEGDAAPELARTTASDTNAAPQFILIADADIKKLKVDELRRELK